MGGKSPKAGGGNHLGHGTYPIRVMNANERVENIEPDRR